MEISNYKTAEKALLKKGYYIDGVIEEAERHEQECGSNFGRGDFDYELTAGKFVYFELVKPAMIELYNCDTDDTIILNINNSKINELLDKGYDIYCDIEEPTYRIRF